MAQRMTLVDDLDQASTADETITFSLDGVSYEIDLSGANAERLRSDLAPWIGHARRLGGRKAPGRKTAGKSSANAIRAWAIANGMEVSSRGRVPADVRAAYEEANPGF